MAATNLRLEILDEGGRGLDTLAEEWDKLYSRVPDASPALRRRWCAEGWATVGRPRGRELFVSVVRDGDRLVAVWPLTISREDGRRIARWAGSETQEERDVLMHPAANRADVSSLLMTALFDREVDLVMAPYVPARSAFVSLFGEQAGFVAHRYDIAYVTMIADWSDFDSYYRARPASLRSGQRNRWRRLNRLGEPNLWFPNTGAEAESLFDWLVEQKLAWVARNQRANYALGSPETIEFLRKAVIDGLAEHTSSLCALRADERIVAGKYSFCGASEYYSTLTAYDPAFAAVSPGRLLTELFVRHCFHEGVRSIDWSIGLGHWKSIWADRRRSLGTFALVASRSGWGALPSEHRPNQGDRLIEAPPSEPTSDTLQGGNGNAHRSRIARAGRMGLKLEIVRDERGFDLLREDWERLWNELHIPRLFLGFDWCRRGWECVGKVRGRKLFVVVVRDGSECAAIWPLSIAAEQEGRVARWLGSEASETRDLLVHPRADAGSLGSLLHDELRASGEIDTVIAPYVREESHFVRLFAGREGFSRQRRLIDLICPIDESANWGDYQSSLSARLRSEQRALWRQLAARGPHELTMATTREQAMQFFHWLIVKKSEWFMEKRITPLSVVDAETIEFQRELVLRSLDTGRLYLTAIKSNGEIIAAFLAFLDFECRTMRAWLTTYDLAHSALSPSRLLIESATRWCFEQRYAILDWGPYADYKHRWAKRRVPYGVYTLDLSHADSEPAAEISEADTPRVPAACS